MLSSEVRFHFTPARGTPLKLKRSCLVKARDPCGQYMYVDSLHGIFGGALRRPCFSQPLFVSLRSLLSYFRLPICNLCTSMCSPMRADFLGCLLSTPLAPTRLRFRCYVSHGLCKTDSSHSHSKSPIYPFVKKANFLLNSQCFGEPFVVYLVAGSRCVRALSGCNVGCHGLVFIVLSWNWCRRVQYMRAPAHVAPVCS